MSGELVIATDTASLRVGDRLRVSGFSNRNIHIVDDIPGAYHCEVKRIIRPSRGYAKHIRRRKAGK